MAKLFPVWIVPVYVVLMGARKIRDGVRRIGRGFKRTPSYRTCQTCGYMALVGSICTKCGAPEPSE